jgi:hypothetical protein
MERGWKERVTVFLPIATQIPSKISVCRVFRVTISAVQYRESIDSITSGPPRVWKTMGVHAVLSRLLSGDETDVVIECRQCGTNLTPDTDECPECESDEIGHYRISE